VMLLGMEPPIVSEDTTADCAGLSLG